jgi:hypothetical protein
MMSRHVHRVLIRFLMATCFVPLTGGCDFTADPGGSLPAGLSCVSDGLVTFLQEFAREALAAFLY